MSHLASILFFAAILSSSATGTPVLPVASPPQSKCVPENLAQVQDQLYVSIEKQARALIARLHPWEQDQSLLLLTDSKSTEHWIRPNTGLVEGLAFLARFGPYDAQVIGMTREQLVNEKLLPMMRYLIATHLTGDRPTSDGKQWGSHWQSAHWTHMLARAAWWTWDLLPADVQSGVRRVVAHEADRIAAMDPPHQIKEDTKSEENAWNSQILSGAVLLMPEDPRRATWEREFQRWAMSSMLRPADEFSARVVDGRRVCEQFTGANIYDDFTCENHNRVHPDYMECFALSMGCSLDYRMSGRQAPDAAFYNTAEIYENLKWFAMPSGGVVYPNGQDWGLMRDPHWLFLHALMVTVGHDPDAWRLMMRCFDTRLKMQARNQNGDVFLDEEFFFPSTRTDLIASASMSWLALEYADRIDDRFSDKIGVRRLDGGKIVMNRTGRAIHTLSWGAELMMQFMPNAPDRLTSPHAESGFGHVILEGSEKPLPVSLRDIEVTSNSRGFSAHIEVDHGSAVRAHIDVKSRHNGALSINEKLVALRDVTTKEVATGLIGVLNDPHWIYETGERTIAMDGAKKVVAAESGADFGAVAKLVTVDDVLRVRAAKKINVRYQAARDFERGRVTDMLYLNYIGDKRTWKSGDTVSEYAVVIDCMDGSK